MSRSCRKCLNKTFISPEGKVMCKEYGDEDNLKDNYKEWYTPWELENIPYQCLSYVNGGESKEQQNNSEVAIYLMKARDEIKDMKTHPCLDRLSDAINRELSGLRR